MTVTIQSERRKCLTPRARRVTSGLISVVLNSDTMNVSLASPDGM